jgi:hypothetical protein
MPMSREAIRLGGPRVRIPLPPALSPLRTSLSRKFRPERALHSRFGGVDVNRFFAAVHGYLMIAELRTEPEQRRLPDLIKPQTRSV